jgi:hypothetical protein
MQSFSLRNFNGPTGANGSSTTHCTAVVSKFDKPTAASQQSKKKVYNIREAIQKNDLVRIR